ncbi:MAG: hypothetical protein WCT37_01150 [Patescibacteria group bacterium]|jgi:hypothetical protein
MQCKNCQKEFIVFPAELPFFEKMDLPLPKLCPTCRAQRRWSFRNQSQLYKRKCDFTGEEMISLYAADSPFKVYREDVWWSDKWDPMSYGRDFDFSRPFFDQFQELRLAVPRRGMQQDGTNTNCDFTTFGMSNKNCYLAFACFYCEEVYYSAWAGMTKDSLDCFMTISCELVYQCVDCTKCYHCFYCQDSVNCLDSYFLDNCFNCQNCIACKNLQNKQYYIYNQLVTPEKFAVLKQKLESGQIEETRNKFNQLKLKFPVRYAHVVASENCDGDYLDHGKNCHDCFGISYGGTEDCWHCQMVGAGGKDMIDCCMAGQNSQLIYEMQAILGAYHSAFTNFCRFSNNVYYCDSIGYCDDCFGCVGLNHKKFCLLNKQYEEEEYKKLLPRVIEHLKNTGEWGENFPVKQSPFPYNDTLSQEFFPISREEALAKGYSWRDNSSAVYQEQTYEVNANIEKVRDDILKAVLACQKCGKNYKVIPQELKFYRQMKITVPRECPDCRHLRRMRQRNPMKLYSRKCQCINSSHGHNGGCSIEFKTTYAPDRPEKVYCEECYRKEIY